MDQFLIVKYLLLQTFKRINCQDKQEVSSIVQWEKTQLPVVWTTALFLLQGLTDATLVTE